MVAQADIRIQIDIHAVRTGFIVTFTSLDTDNDQRRVAI